jgi:hypothetical protein
LVHILLIHQNYPGQFRHLASSYLLPFNRCGFPGVSQQTKALRAFAAVELLAFFYYLLTSAR